MYIKILCVHIYIYSYIYAFSNLFWSNHLYSVLLFFLCCFSTNDNNKKIFISEKKLMSSTLNLHRATDNLQFWNNLKFSIVHSILETIFIVIQEMNYYTGLQKKFNVQLAFLLLNTNLKAIFSHHVQIFQNFITKV